MKFIAGLRVWRNWGIVENVLKVFLKLRGSANRRVDLFLPLIASILGRRRGARGERSVASETIRATFGGTLASRELWFGRSGSDRYLSLLWGLVPRVSGRIPSGASCPK